ncbi:MAG TPA: hypothetical protein VIY73_24620 [Polyangiaceae bacterium]
MSARGFAETSELEGSLARRGFAKPAGSLRWTKENVCVRIEDAETCAVTVTVFDGRCVVWEASFASAPVDVVMSLIAKVLP